MNAPPHIADRDVSPSATATAPSGAPAAALPGEPLVIPQDLLDGGEVVILAIKPSLWFVLFEPLWWIVGTVAVLAALPRLCELARWGVSPMALAQAVLALLALRILVSVLRWVSRFYVLTNRRVMWIRGVLHAHCWGCPLSRIEETRLTAEVHEKVAHLGTLHFLSDDLPTDGRAWDYIARPDDVHAEVRRAIARARNHQAGVSR